MVFYRCVQGEGGHGWARWSRNSGAGRRAARAEGERLRARIEELAEDLARKEEQVTRLVITREEV